MFGVGTKRATVALANIIEIKTRIKGKRTKILKYDEDWVVKDPSWYITPYEAENYEEEISESNTQVNLSNLRKSFDDHYINKIKKYFSQIYAYYLHEGILILKVNEEQIKPHFYDNWTYAPSYNPTKYSGFVQIGLRKVKVEIYSGLSNKSSASDDWGVHIYCNKRLIGKNLKTEEVGFGNGQAGKPHVSISLLNVLVFLSGDAELMPWNSSKSEINYSHELFKKIQSSIKEAVINNAKISRALEGKWNEELFKYSTGEIKEQFVTFDKGLKKNLPPIPPSKKTDEKKIYMHCLMRSSVDSAKENLAETIRALFELAGAKVGLTGSYPGWKPNMNSAIMKTMDKVYKAKYGKDLEIKDQNLCE